MPISESGKYALLDELAEDFAARYRKGERPALQEYIDRHPELADDIRELLPAMVEIEQIKEDIEVPASAPGVSAPTLTQLGDYHILREIGHGGMGVVYEAEQVSLGRRVALKLLPQQLLRDAKQRRRFEREAKAAAKLHHTNIVPVFGVGDHDSHPYYVMQFIQGLGLDEVLLELQKLQPGGPAMGATGAEPRICRRDLSAADVARSLLTGVFQLPSSMNDAAAAPAADATVDQATGAAEAEPPLLAPASVSSSRPAETTSLSSSSVVLPGHAVTGVKGRKPTFWQSVARLGVQVADALAYAHRQGILHRDVKPSNLLLDTAGTVWLTDFGLAKAQDQQNLTQTGDILGTLRYMPPEAFDGKSDPRSDVYSLGLTLYEMLALRPAFDAPERHRLIKQVTTVDPVRLNRLNRSIPRDLVTVVHKAIERDPSHRYATADELAADLRRFLDDEPIHARRISTVERLYRWCRRNRVVASLTTAVLLLITAFAVVSGIGTIWLGKALDDSETNLRAAQEANAEGNAKLWDSLLSQARASRMTRQPGQRFDSLRAIQKALALPLPPGRSLDELRTEAIAALMLPDLKVAKEWDGWPVGSSAFAVDRAFHRYARADKDGNVTVRRLEDDVELFRLPGASSTISPYWGLEFSPDGQFLHHACEAPGPRRAKLWNLERREPVVVLEGSHHTVAFRPDSRQVALSADDGTVRLHTLPSGRQQRQWQSGLPGNLRWNPRHPQLAFAGGRLLKIFDAETGKTLLEKEFPRTVGFVDWHPDGSTVALSDDESKITFWDTRTGQQARPSLVGHKNEGVVFHFNHPGDRLVSNDWSGILRLWDTRTGRQLLTLSALGAVAQFREDDALVAADLALKARLIRCRLGQEFCTVPAVGADESFGGPAPLHKDGRLFALTTSNHLTALMDGNRGDEVARLPLEGLPLCFEPDGGALWTVGPHGLLRWPLRTDAALRSRYHIGPPRRLAGFTAFFSGCNADVNRVAIPNYNRGALLWQRQSSRVLSLGPQRDVRFCAVSPDGRWVATGSHNADERASAQVWDGESGKHAADLPVGSGGNVGFSPDGKWLMTTGGGQRLWQVDSWREGPALGGSVHNASFAFAADSKLLGLGDPAPGVVRLIVPDTGKEVARLSAPEQSRLWPQSFTPDGARLITVGRESGALHIFDLRAIRAQLKELDLDWDAPPLPPASKDPSVPLEVVVDLGNFREQAEATRLVSEANRLVRANKHAQALTALRQAIKTDPSHAMAHNNLAWQLLMGPKDLRDAKTALPLARKAVALAPNQYLYLNTLGVALFRNGEFKEAVPVLEKSLAKGKGEADAFDLFFLGMCHHRLGDAGKAKDCYDRAAKWFQEHRANLSAGPVRELTEFQAEAKLLCTE